MAKLDAELKDKNGHGSGNGNETKLVVDDASAQTGVWQKLENYTNKMIYYIITIRIINNNKTRYYVLFKMSTKKF